MIISRNIILVTVISRKKKKKRLDFFSPNFSNKPSILRSDTLFETKRNGTERNNFIRTEVNSYPRAKRNYPMSGERKSRNLSPIHAEVLEIKCSITVLLD